MIDHNAGEITTSEGQAYAMLRAVWLNDQATFDKVNRWALDNLNSSVRNDHLWAWKWGKDAGGQWRVLDKAFASDADEDAALALILASRTWNEPLYSRQALATLADLWDSATISAGGRRYLLAGDSECSKGRCRLNPSYCAPYAYRTFAAVDRNHRWSELADSTYDLLEACSRLSETHLPPDWVELDVKSGKLAPVSGRDSNFSYDAFRVYWRIDMDWTVNHNTRAKDYMRSTLGWILKEWQTHRKLPAIVTAGGLPGAEYESLEMVSGLMPAVDSVNPEVAAQMNLKLQESYSNGTWGGGSYYLQNWAWFGTALYYKHLPPRL